MGLEPHAARRGLSGAGASRSATWHAVRWDATVEDGLVRIVVAGIDVRRRLTPQHQHAARWRNAVPQRARESDVELQHPGLIHREAHRNDVGGMAGDDLPRVVDPARAIGHRRDRVAQVERAPVVAAQVAVIERDEEIAQRQVRLRERPHQPLRQSICLDEPPSPDERPNLGQYIFRGRIVPVRRPTRPERVVVQLQVLDTDVPEHHRADAAVTNRKRLDPLRRGASVGQEERRSDVSGPSAAAPAGSGLALRAERLGLCVRVAREGHRSGRCENALEERAAVHASALSSRSQWSVLRCRLQSGRGRCRPINPPPVRGATRSPQRGETRGRRGS